MMNNSISFSSSKTMTQNNNSNFAPISRHSNYSSASDLIDVLANTKAIRTLAEMYSGLMEETITPRFTLHLLNVQIAAFFTIIPVEFYLFTRILCLCWFISSTCLAARAYRQQ